MGVLEGTCTRDPDGDRSPWGQRREKVRDPRRRAGSSTGDGDRGDEGSGTRPTNGATKDAKRRRATGRGSGTNPDQRRGSDPTRAFGNARTKGPHDRMHPRFTNVNWEEQARIQETMEEQERRRQESWSAECVRRTLLLLRLGRLPSRCPEAGSSSAVNSSAQSWLCFDRKCLERRFRA